MMSALCKRVAALLLCAVLVPCAAGSAESWSQINQALSVADGWRRIVVDSPFSLGGKTEVAMEDGRVYAQIDFGSYPSIDGSTVAVPMAMEFARQHLGMTEADLAEFVAFSTTHQAYEHLIRREPNGRAALVTEGALMDDRRPVDLLIATPPSDEELALAAEHGVGLITKPVCYDAFVFIVHVDNPVESLTLEQIQGIYTGDIRNWSDVGGREEEIMPYQREKNSGSQTAMETLVMRGQTMDARGTAGFMITDMSSLVYAVGSYRNTPVGLGYTFKYYVDALYRDDAVKVLAIDGVYPTEDNLRSGAYPFTALYYGVIRAGDEQAPGGQFLSWMLSEEGRQCISQAGYIPYDGPAEDQ